MKALPLISPPDMRLESVLFLIIVEINWNVNVLILVDFRKKFTLQTSMSSPQPKYC